jgi:hypothetical protein
MVLERVRMEPGKVKFTGEEVEFLIEETNDIAGMSSVMRGTMQEAAFEEIYSSGLTDGAQTAGEYLDSMERYFSEAGVESLMMKVRRVNDCIMLMGKDPRTITDAIASEVTPMQGNRALAEHSLTAGRGERGKTLFKHFVLAMEEGCTEYLHDVENILTGGRRMVTGHTRIYPSYAVVSEAVSVAKTRCVCAKGMVERNWPFEVQGETGLADIAGIEVKLPSWVRVFTPTIVLAGSPEIRGGVERGTAGKLSEVTAMGVRVTKNAVLTSMGEGKDRILVIGDRMSEVASKMSSVEEFMATAIDEVTLRRAGGGMMSRLEREWIFSVGGEVGLKREQMGLLSAHLSMEGDEIYKNVGNAGSESWPISGKAATARVSELRQMTGLPMKPGTLVVAAADTGLRAIASYAEFNGLTVRAIGGDDSGYEAVRDEEARTPVLHMILAMFTKFSSIAPGIARGNIEGLLVGRRMGSLEGAPRLIIEKLVGLGALMPARVGVPGSLTVGYRMREMLELSRSDFDSGTLAMMVRKELTVAEDLMKGLCEAGVVGRTWRYGEVFGGENDGRMKRIVLRYTPSFLGDAEQEFRAVVDNVLINTMVAVARSDAEKSLMRRVMRRAVTKIKETEEGVRKGATGMEPVRTGREEIWMDVASFIQKHSVPSRR